jgi:hypothetical protein
MEKSGITRIGPGSSSLFPHYQVSLLDQAYHGSIELWEAKPQFVVSADVLWAKEGEPLELRRPVDIETSEVDGQVQWRLGEFDLVAEGSDDEEAEASLVDQLITLRETYESEPDDRLTPGAKDLKKKLVETLG